MTASSAAGRLWAARFRLLWHFLPAALVIGVVIGGAARFEADRRLGTLRADQLA